MHQIFLFLLFYISDYAQHLVQMNYFTVQWVKALTEGSQVISKDVLKLIHHTGTPHTLL